MHHTQSISFNSKYLQTLTEIENSCVFIRENFESTLSLLPQHLSDLKKAIKDLFNAKIAKFDPEIDGIFLNFKNVKCYANTELKDRPDIHLHYNADIYVFRPKIGSLLTGIVNKKSPHYIGCLVHSAFNVTIPKPKSIQSSVSWMGNNVSIGQEVTFKVTNLDFSGKLPYIRAEFQNSKIKYFDSDSSLCSHDSINEDNVSEQSFKNEEDFDAGPLVKNNKDKTDTDDFEENNVYYNNGKRKKNKKSGTGCHQEIMNTELSNADDVTDQKIEKKKKRKAGFELDEVFPGTTEQKKKKRRKQLEDNKKDFDTILINEDESNNGSKYNNLTTNSVNSLGSPKKKKKAKNKIEIDIDDYQHPNTSSNIENDDVVAKKASLSDELINDDVIERILSKNKEKVTKKHKRAKK